MLQTAKLADEMLMIALSVGFVCYWLKVNALLEFQTVWKVNFLLP